MRNSLLIICCLLMLATPNCCYGAYRISSPRDSTSSLYATGLELDRNAAVVSDQKVSHIHHLINWPDRGWGRHNNRGDDGRNGNRAFVLAIVGLVFWPLGAVAMYFGVKGWKKGQRNRELAIIGFILGTAEAIAAAIFGIIAIYLIFALGFV